MNFTLPGLVGILCEREYVNAFSNDCFSFKDVYISESELFPQDKNCLTSPIGIVKHVERISSSPIDNNYFSENHAFACICYGEFFDEYGKRKDVDWLLQRITEKGTAFLNSLNGTYTLAIYEKKNQIFKLRTDRYSTRLLYYSIIDSKVFFANDMRILLGFAENTPEINNDSLMDFLCYEFILCNETFYKDIFVFPHGMELSWNGEKVSFERYWDYPQSIPSQPQAKIDDYVDQAEYLMRQSVERRIQRRPNLWITLSAGLDSRAIACFSNSIDQKTVNCLHIGSLNSDATVWARQICEELSGNFFFTPFESIEFEKAIPVASKLLSGQVSLNQSIIFFLLMKELNASTDNYVLDGQVQDVLLEPLYIPNYRPQKITEEIIIDQIVKHYQPVPKSMLSILLKDQNDTNFDPVRKSRILQHLGGKQFDDFPALMQYFYLTSRGQRYVWGAPSLEFAIADIGFPGMDYDLFDWGVNLPHEMRQPDGELYRKVLCKFFPDVAQIPWDATGKPLSAPYKRIQISRSRFSKDYLSSILLRLSAGKIDLLTSSRDNNRLFRTDKSFHDAFMEPVKNMRECSENPLTAEGLNNLAHLVSSGRNYFGLIQRAVGVVDFFNQR